MSATATIEALLEAGVAFPTSVGTAEVYQEDVHKIIRILYRDGSKIEETAEGVANIVKQSHIYRVALEKMRKTIETQLWELSNRILQWCNDNSEHLFCGIMAYSEEPRKNCFDVHFFAIQNSNHYNDEFSRNLTRLEIEIEDSEQFSWIDMKVLELPKMDEEHIQKFVHNFTSVI